MTHQDLNITPKPQTQLLISPTLLTQPLVSFASNLRCTFL